MTVDQILKLDVIQSAKDLTWREESPNAGEPECLCSACGLLVKAEEIFEKDKGYHYSHSEASDANFPIRLWDGDGPDMKEAVIHTECFLYLCGKGLIKMNRDGSADIP